MQRSLYLIALLATLSFFSCDPEPPKPEPPAGTYVFGGETSDIAYDVIETPDGDLLLVGGIEDASTKNYDVCFILSDKNGNQKQAFAYGLPSRNEVGFRITKTASGYAVLGMSAGSQYSEHQIYLLILDEDLEVTDEKSYTANYSAYGGSGFSSGIYPTPDGGLLLSYSSGRPQLILLDVNLEESWRSEYENFSYGEYAQFLCRSARGGFALFGASQNYYTGNGILNMVRMNDFGSVQWSSDDSLSSSGLAIHGCTPLSNGGFVVSASEYYGGNPVIVYVDSAGRADLRVQAGTNSDYRFLHQTSDGGVLMAGYTSPNLSSGSDYATSVLKVDSNGTVGQERLYTGDRGDKIYQMIPLSDGSYAIVGNTTRYGAGRSDMLLIIHQQ